MPTSKSAAYAIQDIEARHVKSVSAPRALTRSTDLAMKAAEIAPAEECAVIWMAFANVSAGFSAQDASIEQLAGREYILY